MPRRPSAELQSFGREARRLLRHAIIREALTGEEREHLGDLTDWYLRMRACSPSLPKSIKRQNLQLVRSVQRSVDDGEYPANFYTEYSETITGAMRLLTGCFCGQRSPVIPNSQCSICLSQTGGRWWFSFACGHYFHLGCIAPHVRRDNRCPLCRVEFL
jgi:hypothetical protein